MAQLPVRSGPSLQAARPQASVSSLCKQSGSPQSRRVSVGSKCSVKVLCQSPPVSLPKAPGHISPSPCEHKRGQPGPAWSLWRGDPGLCTGWRPQGAGPCSGRGAPNLIGGLESLGRGTVTDGPIPDRESHRMPQSRPPGGWDTGLGRLGPWDPGLQSQEMSEGQRSR